jgi:small subunit ribosomal protein S1
MALYDVSAIPVIKEGHKVKGIVRKKTSHGVLLDCMDGAFSGMILSKEVKNLERNDFDLTPGTTLEVEIVDPSMKSEDGFYIVSVSQLLQRDIWSDVMTKFSEGSTFTVRPTEANLGGLIVDMYGIKGFIPLSQLAPLHYPRVEDGDQEAIFEKLLALIGEEFEVKIINIDEEDKRIILSEREALKEQKEKILEEMEVGSIYEGVISGISSYGFFVTINQAVEGLVHISEITFGHVNNLDRFGKVGDPMKVKVIGLDNGKISLSAKQLREDPWSVIEREYNVGDIIEGQVVRYVPYGVFVRVYDDINGLIHLSELSNERISNPNDVVKIGQVVKSKIILLDTKARKIGLSMKHLAENKE